jgi:hypothetical protein
MNKTIKMAVNDKEVVLKISKEGRPWDQVKVDLLNR